MSRLLEWLEVTPLVQKVSLLGLFMVLCGVGFYWVIAEPLIEQVDGVRRDIQDLEAKVNRYSRSDDQYRQAKEKLSRLESLVSRQQERLGLEVPMSQVLSDMSHIAEEAGIILTLWKPDRQKGVDRNQNVARHLQLHIEGGYHKVARFLEHTQHLSKMMGVASLTMVHGDTEDGGSPVRATVNFVGYDGGVRTLAIQKNETLSLTPVVGKG